MDAESNTEDPEKPEEILEKTKSPFSDSVDSFTIFHDQGRMSPTCHMDDVTDYHALVESSSTSPNDNGVRTVNGMVIGSNSQLAEKSYQSIRWLQNKWNSWAQAKYEKDDSSCFIPCTLDMLITDFRHLAPEYLTMFITEVKSEKGEQLSPQTLNHMTSILQMTIKNINNSFNVYSDMDYQKFRVALENRKAASRALGIQRLSLNVGVITPEMEKDLWHKNLLGAENPKKLLVTIYFLVSKHFGVRARAHHRELRWNPSSQINLKGEGDNEHIEFIDSYNLKPGQPRPPVYMRKTGGPYCPVEIMKKYISLIPKLSQNFYNKPHPRPRPNSWYCDQPIGVNKFPYLLKDIAEKAGWDMSNSWNAHSLDSRTVTKGDNGLSQFYDEIHGCAVSANRSSNCSEPTNSQSKSVEIEQIQSNGSISAQNCQQNVSKTADNSYNGSLSQTKQLTTPRRSSPELDERVMDCRKRPLKKEAESDGYECKPVPKRSKETSVHHDVNHNQLKNVVSSIGMDNIKGKVAIVTGASSGFGKAISILLAKQGVKVGMAARRIERLNEISQTISAEGGQCLGVQTDVTKLKDVEEMHRKVELALGPVDILVNNAGYMHYTEMTSQAYSEWDKTVDINIKGVNNCIGVVLPGMVKREKGHIVNMSSDAGKRGFAGLAVYSGTKFYIEGLSQAIRQEVSKNHIKVTCIEPGNAETEIFANSYDSAAREKYDGTLAGKYPILSPEDVAQSVLYAVSQPEHVAINEVLIQPRAEAF